MRASRDVQHRKTRRGEEEGEGYRDIRASLSRESPLSPCLSHPSILFISALSRSEIARRIIQPSIFQRRISSSPLRQTQFLMPHTGNEHLGERFLARVQLSRELSTVIPETCDREIPLSTVSGIN